MSDETARLEKEYRDELKARVRAQRLDALWNGICCVTVFVVVLGTCVWFKFYGPLWFIAGATFMPLSNAFCIAHAMTESDKR
jgi:hypothetical protein